MAKSTTTRTMDPETPKGTGPYELLIGTNIDGRHVKAGATVYLDPANAADMIALGRVRAPAPGYNRRDMRARD